MRGSRPSTAPDERREYALGVSYRSYRFRLATDNATPSGIGENHFIPIFLRVSQRLSKDARIDFYGALATYGNASVDYETAAAATAMTTTSGRRSR